MRKVITNEWMTLDGVVQAPSDAGEDVPEAAGHVLAGIAAAAPPRPPRS